MATMRQDRASRGTLVGLESSNGRRQFEIVSNGRANTLDLVYWVDGSQNVVSFEDVDLSDSQWKNITLHVHGENAHLYVGCTLIDSFILDDPFYEHLQPEGSRMYVAKGSIRENHFRVSSIFSNWEVNCQNKSEVIPGFTSVSSTSLCLPPSLGGSLAVVFICLSCF